MTNRPPSIPRPRHVISRPDGGTPAGTTHLATQRDDHPSGHARPDAPDQAATRVLVCAVPLIGHVAPLLALARALTARGHDVHFYTGSRFRDRVEAAGARFETMSAALDPDGRPLEEFLPELRALTGLANLRYALKHFFIDSGGGQLTDLRRIVPRLRPDVVVVDAAFRGAALLCELGEGPPWVAVGVMPLMLSSRDTAPFGPGLLLVPGRLGRLRNVVLRRAARVLMRDVIRYADAQRSRLGLPPRHELVFDSALSPYLYLQTGVPALEYPRSDLPPQVHFVGLMSEPPSVATRDLPPWWGEVVHSGRPVVHVTQGTVSTDPQELLIPTLRALADAEVLVVATTGGSATGVLGDLPANARAAEFVPHTALLPHVSVMVTNGGYGGVLGALGHAVPLVVGGSTQDKPEVASRVQFAGAGINLRAGRPTEADIRQAVDRVLTDPRFRRGAEAVAADLARHGGAGAAADLVEAVAVSGRPVHQSTVPERGPCPPAPRCTPPETTNDTTPPTGNAEEEPERR